MTIRYQGENRIPYQNGFISSTEGSEQTKEEVNKTRIWLLASIQTQRSRAIRLQPLKQKQNMKSCRQKKRRKQIYNIIVMPWVNAKTEKERFGE